MSRQESPDRNAERMGGAVGRVIPHTPKLNEPKLHTRDNAKTGLSQNWHVASSATLMLSSENGPPYLHRRAFTNSQAPGVSGRQVFPRMRNNKAGPMARRHRSKGSPRGPEQFGVPATRTDKEEDEKREARPAPV